MNIYGSSSTFTQIKFQINARIQITTLVNSVKIVVTSKNYTMNNIKRRYPMLLSSSEIISLKCCQITSKIEQNHLEIYFHNSIMIRSLCCI